MKYLAVTLGALGFLSACAGGGDSPEVATGQSKAELVGDVMLVSDLNETGSSLPSEFAEAGGQF